MLESLNFCFQFSFPFLERSLSRFSSAICQHLRTPRGSGEWLRWGGGHAVSRGPGVPPASRRGLPASPIAICPSLPPQAARFPFIGGERGSTWGRQKSGKKGSTCGGKRRGSQLGTRGGHGSAVPSLPILAPPAPLLPTRPWESTGKKPARQKEGPAL